MGLSNLGGKICLDSNIIIYIVEREPRYYTARTPDAIHWATARVEQANHLITNDQNLLQISGGFALSPAQLTI